MIQFHETVMGRRFFEGQLPRLIDALEKIAKAMTKEPPKVEKCPDCGASLETDCPNCRENRSRAGSRRGSPTPIDEREEEFETNHTHVTCHFCDRLFDGRGGHIYHGKLVCDECWGDVRLRNTE